MSGKKGSGVCRRLLCAALTVLMLFEASGSALAYLVTGEGSAPTSVVYTDTNGNTQPVDESWEETFPYGAFAFETSGLALSEGESGVIKVYRLGGTTGRATAYLTYEPVLLQDENGGAVYDYAVSANDVAIQVEEPLPRARYDAVGMPPVPETGDAAVRAVPDELGYSLRLSETAQSYQWQILSDGAWKDIQDAAGAEVPADAEFIDSGSYDYRCIYTLGGVEYCSVSLRGTVYEKPEEEVLAQRPEGLELNAEPVYTPLDLLGEGEDPYNGWAFELIFADGEWVKEIHLDALTDQLPEAQEAAAFTIRDCEGGQVLESANTLLFRIEDANDPEPSTLGFTVSQVTVDQADGTAQVMIERVGGAQRPVSVEYTTVDATALAGRDYAQTSGKLMFYAGVTRLPVTVELIDDGAASMEPVSFEIVLSELLGDDSCRFAQDTVRVELINSGRGGAANLATQLYDPEAVDVSGAVAERDGAANAGSGRVTGAQVAAEEPEPVYSTLVDDGAQGDISLQAYAPSLKKIVFANPQSAWTGTAEAAQKSYWGIGTNTDGAAVLYGAGDTAKKIGKDYNGSVDVTIDKGVALASRKDADAVLKSAGWEALGGAREIAGQLFSGYRAEILTRMGHDTSYLDGFTYKYSYTEPRLWLMQGSTSLVDNPRYIKRFGSGPFDYDWTIRASDDGSNYYNPFSGTYSGGMGFTGSLSLGMSLWYASYDSHQHDELNDASMVWLKSMSLTRRIFAVDAFKTEVSTPNDSNTAPANCAVLSESNYSGFQPKVEIVGGKGGVNGSNQLYVGSTVKITAGTAPAGYYVSNVVVYQSTDGGSTWKTFGKFGAGSYDAAEKSYTFKLVGSASAPLNDGDLRAQYKFRVCYSRSSTITVDFEKSVPRRENSLTQIDTDKINYPLNGYYDGSTYGSDHGFTYGVSAAITYGYSTFNSSTGDFGTACTETTLAKPTALSGAAEWSFDATNIQWVCFNLSSRDLLLINGTAYAGNAKIYLQEADFAGGLSVLYYHEDYRTAQSAMKTAISWMAVYWDANGNGKIDGYYNETNSSFVLTAVDGVRDEFCAYVTGGSANETQFAPKKNANGDYCQYFIKACYTMTPRSLVVPEGASESERAQILPALVTAVNPDSAAYSRLTPEQRAYRYLVSGLTRQNSSAAETRSADGHLKYGAAANARSTLDIPLGGDVSPATLAEGAAAYTWNPVFRGNMLYPFAAPEPITVENSIAGPTPVTQQYTIERDEEGIITGYAYTEEGLKRMNGYLSSFTGTTTFALVTQEQRYSTADILAGVQSGVKLGGGAAGTDDDTLYVQDAADYSVRPDSVTLGGYSTTPDAEYLKQMQDESSPNSDVDMDDSGSEMSEFNVDLGINLGSMELAVTDYVTILLDENKVGFAVGLPLGETGDESKGFADKNKDNWTQFGDFFKKGNFGGDESYKKAATEHTRKKNADAAAAAASPNPSSPPQPNPYDKTQFKSKSFSVGFAVGLAFLFEYNPLDNGYYFEGMTVSFSVSLTFRIQARLTVCPIVYFYFQFDGSIEIATGLGVIRDSVEITPAVLDAKSAANYEKQISLTYMARPSAGAVITQAAYEKLTAAGKLLYKAADLAGYYYSAAYPAFADAKAVYLETGDYFLTGEQYGVLTDTEKENYEWTVSGAYNKSHYRSYSAALEAYNAAAAYSFETGYKAFNVRFSGKLAVDVYTKQDGAWKPAPEGSGYISGFISSDGKADTQVVLKKQDGMTLAETVKVVLRPLDYDTQTTLDKTTISYIAQIQDIRNEVYWKGISISPSIGLEVGAGVGVELLKVELYAKLGLEATFLLGVYNTNYDPYDMDAGNDEKYAPASVESFGFSIGIGLRVVLLAFTFELDAATYCVDYDGADWETGWHFLNDWVQDASEDGFLGVTIRPPQSTEQKLYAPEDNAEPELGTLAYDPTDETVPFQLSGYGSSVDAANLSTAVLPGGDYKVIRAGERDFIVYTVSRSEAGIAGEDVPQLVMSELKRVNTAADGQTPAYKYGLANPTGASGAGVPLYLVLDPDGTGDLDFDVWVEEGSDGTSGAAAYTIHSTWVSYASAAQTEPTKPGSTPYGGMNADNYKTIPAPSAPAESAYYTATGVTYTTEEYGQLPQEEQALCKETGSGTWTKYTLAEGYATLAAAESAYQAAQSAYAADRDSYQAWHAYYLSLDSYNAYLQDRLKSAAQNTVLKAAEWSYTSTPYSGEGEGAPEIRNDAAFHPAQILGGDGAGGSVGYVFAPASNGSGSAVFFGSTLTQDASGEAYDRYVQFLTDSGMADTDYADYLKSTKKSTLDVLGTRSNLNLACQSGGVWKVSSMALAEGQTLGNVEFTQLDDGAYYLAYTTRQDAYEGSGKNADHLTVERLFLRKVTASGDTVEWGTPYLLRMTRDYDQDSGKDGIYTAAGAFTAYESPYFSNLSFLTAAVDSDMLTGTEESFSTMAVQEHTFLLFEMNGATYLILDDSLKSITASQTGAIHPFFTGAKHADGAQEASGKLEVTIGADAKGNLFAVYVGSVPNTTNNALYLSAYDPATNTWGDGVMLAMRNMDTYEASLRYDWGSLTAQAAYLGLAGEGGGLLTDADVRSLYGEDADNVLANLKAYPDDLGDKNNLTFSNVQAVQGAAGELLVLTQGTLAELGVVSYTNGAETAYMVMPEYADGGMSSSLGMYAVSYGKGSQNLGEGKLAFGHTDFSVGSRLYVSLSAVNTGDTAFRGSPAQPITATLTADGQALASWKIESNIRSGQTLVLDGDCAALERDLPEGTTFTLTLQEYEGAGYEDPASVSVDLFTVEQYPDLGVEDLTVTVANVSADGSTTTLNVEFVAANRGSGKAEGVYAQFTYADATDENGEATYAVLPLTGSDLTVDQARRLETLAADENGDANLAQGILYLYNAADGNNDLEAGYGRRVSGTVTVPSKAFAAGESGYLKLKIELFTGSDRITGLDAGVVNAVHDEYYAANNAQTVDLQAVTRYTAAPSVVIPMGTTTLVPVTAVSARGTRPALSVTEIDDATDGPNIGILNFRQSTATGGSVSGVLSITPSRPGTGVIHLYDADTESRVAVAFTVTEAAEGIDIFNDNGAFTFYNADGTPYDAEAVGNQSWAFNSAPGWGTGGSAEIPLRSNLSIGEQGASFTFRTVAESIDLYFQGSIEVSSKDYPNYQGDACTNATGGSTPTKITLGSNDDNTAYTVTVKITSTTASFDRLVEHYSGGVVPTPDYDGTNPLFIWSRSFPATASITGGGASIPLSLYVLDNNGLDYISINGTRCNAASGAVTQLDGDGLLWRYDFGALAANGNYDITAVDISGNTVSTTLIVDWFNTAASGDETTVAVPRYGADFYLDAAKWGGTPVGTGAIEKLNITFTEQSGNEKATGNTHEVYCFDGSSFAPMTAEASNAAMFKVSGNGIYWTRTVNSDKTWSAQVLYMGQVDANLPQVTLAFNQAGGALEWSAYKTGSAAAQITDVAVNGYKVNAQPGKNLYGTLEIAYNGTYTITAEDAGGNRNSIACTVDALKLDLAGCSAASTGAWNQARNNGRVEADLSGAVGASYHGEDSNEAQNDYHARYQTALVPGGYDLNGLAEDTELVWTPVNKGNAFRCVYEGLTPGAYLLVVRDAADPANVSSLPVSVADDAITVRAVTLNASSSSASDGQVLATAAGGNTESFEFAILAAPGYKGSTPGIADFLALDTAQSTQDDIVWSLADDPAVNQRAKTFTGLKAGQYLVAVRGVYGATQAQLATLVADRKTLNDAKQALAEAKNPAAEELERLKAAVEAAQAGYDGAVQALQNASAAAYEGASGYWDGADVIVVTVVDNSIFGGSSSAGSRSNLRGVSADGNGSAVYTIKSSKADLTRADSQSIVEANQTSNVVLKGGGLAVYIPRGTLEEGFDVNRLIVKPDEAKSGMVVQYTDLGGTAVILPWCLVSDGAAQYITAGAGDYELVMGSADFKDTDWLWGAESIGFTARRELFTGTGEGLFSPNLPMTRAMFVTVLWRMAGSPAAEGGLTFTDLKGEWYRQAVRWAVANGIADGYSAERFGPDDPVSREQMCVFLCRFLEHLGWTLDREFSGAAFADGAGISTWAADCVDICTRAGLVQGVGGNAFAPKQSASRMEVSTLLTRFVTKLVEKYCGV